jgi:uncharacterized protein YegL
VAQETPVAQFKWADLAAGGSTDMGKALTLVADQLKMPPMSARALPPVLVLVSDGQPTDNFNKGLAALLEEPWGKKAVRMAIAIGEDVDLEVLRRFIGHPEIEPLQANNPEALVNYIKWVSTAVLQAASSPASQVAAAPAMSISQSAATPPVPISQTSNVPVPVPVVAAAAPPATAADVW